MKVTPVKVYPVFEGKRLKEFQSNVKPNDILICMKMSSTEDAFLPKKVKVLEETPFYLAVDMGGYRSSVNKSSIYCKKAILYRMI